MQCEKFIERRTFLKKLFALITVIVLLFSMSAYIFASYEEPAMIPTPTGIITGNGVHLRSGAGTSYPSGGLLWYGDQFELKTSVRPYADGYYWRHLKMTSGNNSGNIGYVAEIYIRFDNPFEPYSVKP